MSTRPSRRTNRELAKQFLASKPGYLKWGAAKISEKFDLPLEMVIQIKDEIKAKERSLSALSLSAEDQRLYQEFLDFKRQKSLQGIEPEDNLPAPFEGGDPNNVIIVGDIHEPFCLDGYLEHCRQVQEDNNCGTVLFIGDVIDNHFLSYHETETAALGAEDELESAIQKIANWYAVFPEATVTIGNHDRLVYRKARTAGLSSRWVRGYSEVLGTPGWNFVEEIIHNGVMYVHGENGTAYKKLEAEHVSVVQGHLHAQAYTQFSVGTNHRLFAMQVGCGIDRNAYAMAYGKMGKKPIISCGIVLNDLPVVIPMQL